MKMPVIILLLASLVCGILVCDWIRFEFNWWFLVFFFLILSISHLLATKMRRLRNAIFTIGCFGFFFGVGSFTYFHSDSRTNETFFLADSDTSSQLVFAAELHNFPVENEKWVKWEATVFQRNNTSTSGKILLYFEKDSLAQALNYGDVILFSKLPFSIQGATNPYVFDYRNFLYHRDIHHQVFLKTGEWIQKENRGNVIMRTVFAIRKSCLEILDESTMREESKAVSKAILLGEKSFISDELMLSYSGSGTLHILAVSGLHVGIVMLILGFVLNPIKRYKHGKIIYLLLALSGIWFYTLLTGFSPSILRAAVMFSFVLIGRESEKDTSIYQSLWVSAFILILIDPHVIFQVGFLLSYLAVIGIVFFHPLIYKRLYFKNKILTEAWKISSVSIAAQIATLPLTIYCFHQFPTYFLVANLLVIPVSFGILVLGLATLLLAKIPLLGFALFYLLDILIFVMNEVVRWTENLPLAILDGLMIRWYDALILYLIISAFSAGFIQRSARWLQVSFGLTALFIFSLCFAKMQRLNTHEIVFYQLKNDVVIDFIESGKITSLSTKNPEPIAQEIAFQVYPNRMHQTGKKEADDFILIDSTPSSYNFKNQTLTFINQHQLDSTYTYQFPKCTAVYFYELEFVPPDVLNLLRKNNINVILGPRISRPCRGFLLKNLNPLKTWDLVNQGALKITLLQELK